MQKILVAQPISCRPGEAPKLFGVSRATIYRWAQKGYITIHKRGGRRFLDVAEVKTFIFGLGDQMGDCDETKE